MKKQRDLRTLWCQLHALVTVQVARRAEEAFAGDNVGDAGK